MLQEEPEIIPVKVVEVSEEKFLGSDDSNVYGISIPGTDIELNPSDISDIFNITGLIEGDKTIDGFTDGSQVDKAMYIVMMAFGAAILSLAFPLIILNEVKNLTLSKRTDTINSYLYVSEEGETSKDNSNKLIFAKGKLTFPNPAKDDILEFESHNGITLYRNVEIYQWVRRLAFDENDEHYPYKYQKIWS